MFTLRNAYSQNSIAKIEPKIFYGGEPHFDLSSLHSEITDKYVWIDARITNAVQFMSLVVLLDAIKGLRPARLGLFIPYFPGARQDRREHGFAFTLKVYADILNNLNLDCVCVADAHSMVLPALLNNYVEITSEHIFMMAQELNIPYNGFISPDAGAEKKINKIGHSRKMPVYYGRKIRDVTTGKLSGFACDKLPTGNYLIVDDICDGGGTFIGLANEIIKQSNVELSLYVTHGIFSSGLNKLLEIFDKIYTTDSWPTEKYTDQIEASSLVVIPITEMVRNIISNRIHK